MRKRRRPNKFQLFGFRFNFVKIPFYICLSTSRNTCSFDNQKQALPSTVIILFSFPTFNSTNQQWELSPPFSLSWLLPMPSLPLLREESTPSFLNPSWRKWVIYAGGNGVVLSLGKIPSISLPWRWLTFSIALSCHPPLFKIFNMDLFEPVKDQNNYGAYKKKNVSDFES